MSFVQRVNPAWFLAGAAFFLPIKPAPVNLLLALALVFVLVNQSTRSRLASLFKHPISLAAYALIAWLLITLFFETSNFDSARDYLSKYLRLLLLPFLAAAFLNKQETVTVLDVFCMGVFVSVLGSFAVAFGFFPWPEGSESPLLFKLHITHNFFIALATGYVAYRLRMQWSNIQVWVKAVVLVALALTLYNFFFMVEGRSGWVAMAVLPVVVAYQRIGFKGSLLAAVAVSVVLCALYFGSDFFHTRVNAVFIEVQQWVDGQAIAQDTSNGRRLSFWLHSLEAFVQAPWFGYGMGGFESAVTPHAQAAGFTFEFNNPHNQYLLFAVQGGLLALVLYGIFIGAVLLRNQSQHLVLLHGFILAYVLLNMLNSFHYDFAEGVFFVLGLAALAFPVDQS
ncbi:O-antigen ligase family protein [Limnobacter sp.]|uniref:O-antigen ligase family protein n=1 Tax=Limnobacter sp. TaxID=2003368 RepID=UPI003747E563